MNIAGVAQEHAGEMDILMDAVRTIGSSFVVLVSNNLSSEWVPFQEEIVAHWNCPADPCEFFFA